MTIKKSREMEWDWVIYDPQATHWGIQAIIKAKIQPKTVKSENRTTLQKTGRVWCSIIREWTMHVWLDYQHTLPKLHYLLTFGSLFCNTQDLFWSYDSFTWKLLGISHNAPCIIHTLFPEFQVLNWWMWIIHRDSWNGNFFQPDSLQILIDYRP